ncbi:MAG: DUF1653 domain-containing protein [Gammaproteobacteria bacterium]
MKTGIYQHYKGPLYEVLGQAKQTETLEDLVVYKALYGNYELWVRPKAMFEETVHYEGKTQARFKYLEKA